MKILSFIILSLFISSCASPFPNQKILGKSFPSIEGTALNDKSWNIPKDLKGEMSLLLIGYRQESQFDIDRWLIGLDQTKTNLPIFEIPAIKGFFPRMIKEKIDSGMRRGIPKELWKVVITVYKDGEDVQRFTGNENPNNARVVLLDKDGVVRYFYDRGFSVSSLNNLRKNIKEIK